MKRFAVLLIACALATSCTMQDNPNTAATPGRTPGPYDNLRPNPNVSVGSSSSSSFSVGTGTNSQSNSSPTLTPAGALVMQECAKAVIADAVRAGETKVAMHHFAQIDDCAARVRASILAR